MKRLYICILGTMHTCGPCWNAVISSNRVSILQDHQDNGGLTKTQLDEVIKDRIESDTLIIPTDFIESMCNNRSRVIQQGKELLKRCKIYTRIQGINV